MNALPPSIVAVLAALAVAAAVTTPMSGRQEAAVQAPAPTASAARRVRAPDAQAPRPPHAPAHATSLRQRVERLLGAGTQRERYQAFALLAHCADAIDFDRYLKSLPAGPEAVRVRERYGDGSARVAAACGDLSARQLESRIVLAARAADEGVTGAASAWIEEGPFGDRTALTQRPDDPLIVEWAQQAIARVHAATRRSDIEAIGQFGMLCLNWEMDDVSRVRLLVDSALQRRREDQIKTVLN